MQINLSFFISVCIKEESMNPITNNMPTPTQPYLYISTLIPAFPQAYPEEKNFSDPYPYIQLEESNMEDKSLLKSFVVLLSPYSIYSEMRANIISSAMSFALL